MRNKVLIAMALLLVGTFLIFCRNVYGAIDTWIDIDIKNTNGFKSYMGYKSLTHSDLPQAKLQEICTTDENGFRRCTGRYVIAVGSGVGGQVGDCVDVILENGTSIPCVIGDYKDDKHTDGSNLVGRANGCCSEFIVDVDLLRDDIKNKGDVSVVNVYWNSPVVKIRRYIFNCLKGGLVNDFKEVAVQYD